jgi:hypothetical protein
MHIEFKSLVLHEASCLLKICEEEIVVYFVY